MPMTNTSPNVLEYYVGKGIVTLRPDPPGDTWYDIGNAPEFEFTPTIEELEHFSARQGLRVNDLTITIEFGGEVRIVMEEWTSFNLKIILLGTETITPGVPTPAKDIYEIEIMTVQKYRAAVRFQGLPAQGARWNFQFHAVDFLPTGSLNLLSEEWGPIEINGRIAAVDFAGTLKYGYARRLYDGTDPGWSTVGA